MQVSRQHSFDLNKHILTPIHFKRIKPITNSRAGLLAKVQMPTQNQPEWTSQANYPSRPPTNQQQPIAAAPRLPPGLSSVPILAGPPPRISAAAAAPPREPAERERPSDGLPAYDSATAAYLAGALRPPPANPPYAAPPPPPPAGLPLPPAHAWADRSQVAPPPPPAVTRPCILLHASGRCIAHQPRPPPIR